MNPRPHDVAAARQAIRNGGLRGEALLAWLVAHAPTERDRVVEELLGIGHRRVEGKPLGGELVGYIPSGLAAIVRAFLDIPLGPQDVLLDVGAGLGKVVMLAELLTGARAHGVELQPHLVEEARVRAAELGLTRVSFKVGDARHMHCDDATVFFLYLPFTGTTLHDTLERIHRAAQRRSVVVCTLGLDLPPRDWLVPREATSFWLSLHDSRCPGTQPREQEGRALSGAVAERVAEERP
ncbi:MAG: class I SAM-dependent methyltransferase [Myxococcota bacterium]